MHKTGCSGETRLVLTYLAHHKLESVVTAIIVFISYFIIIITTIIIIIIIIVVIVIVIVTVTCAVWLGSLLHLASLHVDTLLGFCRALCCQCW